MAKRKDKTAWGKKDKHLNITLSLEGWNLAKQRASELGISISEVVERWGRGFDVNFGESKPLPLANSSALELHEALGQKIESQQQKAEIYKKLVDGLIDEQLSNADIAKFAGLLDLDEVKAEKLMRTIKTIKGGKKTNGV